MAKKEKKTEYDLIIIGAGIAGLSGAMYAARLGMKTLCLGTASGSEMPIGGIITTTSFIENYPGFEKISGFELAEKIKKQAAAQELVKIKEEKAEKIEKKGKKILVKAGKEAYEGKALLLTTGTAWKKLDIPGWKEFENKGVAYCALCDAPLFRNKIVAVIGGSNSAVKNALVLAEYAKKVYIIYRRDKLKADSANTKRIEKNEKIGVIYNTNAVRVNGDKIVKSLTLDREFNGKKELEVSGVFAAIGSVPLSGLAKELGVKLNESGEIAINHKTAETSVPGIYAAGDVTDSDFKQAIKAAYQGCLAAHSAFESLKNA